MSYLPDIPYRCPKCGDSRKFASLRELQSHLDEEHSFRKSAFPQERSRSRVFSPLSNQRYSPRRSSREHSGRNSPLLRSFNEDAQAIEERLKKAKELENAHRSSRVGPVGYNSVNGTISMLSQDVMQARQNQWNTADALYQSQDVLESLQLSAEQQQRQQTVSMAQLKNDLEQKEKHLAKASQGLENLTREKLKLAADKDALAEKMQESTGKMTNLESQMRERTENLKEKEREYNELMKFLEGAAEKETVARGKLEDFINKILNRAETAEQELKVVKSQMNEKPPAAPVPKGDLNYLAHMRSDPTRNKTRPKMTNGIGPSSSPGPSSQNRALRSPVNPAEDLLEDPNLTFNQDVPTHTLYSSGLGPDGTSLGPRLSPQIAPLEHTKSQTYHKAKHKSSPSQSIRSRDSGVPDDQFYTESAKSSSRIPAQGGVKPAYYSYEDESDYEGYVRRQYLDDDYSISQSDAPNLEMFGNVSDAPNEFYHSSDEGIPDYYLDDDGILWDGSVFGQGARLPDLSEIQRVSPSGSESCGQVIQKSNPADAYANTIKARTSFVRTPKSPFKAVSKSSEIGQENGNSSAETGTLSPKSSKSSLNNSIKLPKSNSPGLSEPYNRDEYIKSVKNSAKSNVKSNRDSSSPTGGSNDRLRKKADQRNSARFLSRENSSSSLEFTPDQNSKEKNANYRSVLPNNTNSEINEKLVAKEPERQNAKSSAKDSNVIIATADVHNFAESSSENALNGRPVPAKRNAKPDGISSSYVKDQKRKSSRISPRNMENSDSVLRAKQYNHQKISPSQEYNQESDDVFIKENSDMSDSDTVKRKPIKKQSSIGKVNAAEKTPDQSKPPKPPRQFSPIDSKQSSVHVSRQLSQNDRLITSQRSSFSSVSPSGSLTSSEVAKITASSTKTSFDSFDRHNSPLHRKVSHQLSVNVPRDSIQNVSPIRIQMDDLEMMTEADANVILHDTGVGPSGPPTSQRIEEIKRRRLQLFCVFLYLDTKTLSHVSLVCKEWKIVSRHPALWRRVRLRNARISTKYLLVISQWCSQIQSLTLEGLKPRRKQSGETEEEYTQNTRGSLEQGVEELLRVSQNSLVSLKIYNCDNLLTERCLWEVSCYSRLLQRLCYISSIDPLGPEVMWNMGAGCRDITTLIIPPGIPTMKPERFNNKCVQLIGQFYPELKTLSIGGTEVDERGLIALAKQCQRLQVLEFDHMTEIKEETAQSLCENGLKDLQIIEFTNTPITPKAVHIFSKHCRRLRRVNVRVSMSDYFEDTLLKENVDKFKNIVEKFNSLKKRSNLSSILRIKTDAEGKERLRSP